MHFLATYFARGMLEQKLGNSVRKIHPRPVISVVVSNLHKMRIIWIARTLQEAHPYFSSSSIFICPVALRSTTEFFWPHLEDQVKLLDNCGGKLIFLVANVW